MARLTTCPPEVRDKIVAAWSASMHRMFDGERSMEALMNPLVNEPDTQWYSLPHGSFMVLRNAIIGGSANLLFISTKDEVVPELEEAREQLVEAMKQYRLKRINVVYPTVLAWRDFKLLGFKHEGRIRKSVLFDGEWIDAEVLGALQSEIGISRRRRRKRYKKRTDNERTIATTPRPANTTDGSTGRSFSARAPRWNTPRARPDVELQHDAGSAESVSNS